MTFDRKSQFDRSFFDRMLGVGGTPLPARIAGKFSVLTRTVPFSTVVRTESFTVVASK